MRLRMLSGCAFAALSLMTATAAHAAITVAWAPPSFIADGIIDFSTLAPAPQVNPTSFTQGGYVQGAVDVNYVSPVPNVIVNSRGAPGNSSWSAAAPQGFTGISTGSPYKFADLALDLTQWLSAAVPMDVDYQVLDGAAVVAAGSLAKVPFHSLSSVEVQGGGATFTAFDFFVVDHLSNHGFAPGSTDFAVTDNITWKFGNTPQTSAAPEPSTWTIMLLGFVVIGAGLRGSAPQARVRA